MKSVKSSEPVITIIKSDLRRFWVLPLIALILMFLSGAFLVLMGDISQSYDTAPFHSNNNIGYLFSYMLLGVGSGLLVFNYMVSKKSSNYAHALPVTRGRLFASHYIAGAALIILPILLNAMILTAVAGAKFAGDYAVMAGVGTLITMVIYSFTVLAATVSGNIVMHIFCSGLFNGLALMVLLICSSYMTALLFGYSISEGMEELIKDSLVLFAFRNGVSAVILTSYLIVLAVVSLAAFLIYRVRPVENAGDSLVFGWTKAVLPGIVTFLGALLAGLVTNALLNDKGGISSAMVIGIAAGFILSFILITVITERSQKIFIRRNIISFAVTALIIVVLAGGLVTDVFGYGSRVPDASETTSAGVRLFCAQNENMMNERIRAEYFKGQYLAVGKGLLSSESDSLMMLEDKNNINEALAVQRIIADRKKEMQQESREDIVNAYSSAFETEGKIIKRSYDMVDKKTEKMIRPHLKKIFESDEVKEAYSLSNLRYSIRNAEYVRDDGTEAKTVPKEKIDGLVSAMDRDFRDMAYEDYYNAAAADEEYDPEKERVSLTLYDNKYSGKKYDEDGYVTEMYIYLDGASRYTKQWIRENLK